MVQASIQTQPIISDPIAAYEIGDDSVILLGASALVSSKSEPGCWHEVDALLNLCACKGFQFRGKCRHVDAVKAAEEMDRETALPIETALEALTSAPQPEIAELAAEILKDLEESRPELSNVERRALAKVTARIRKGAL